MSTATKNPAVRNEIGSNPQQGAGQQANASQVLTYGCKQAQSVLAWSIRRALAGYGDGGDGGNAGSFHGGDWNAVENLARCAKQLNRTMLNIHRATAGQNAGNFPGGGGDLANDLTGVLESGQQQFAGSNA